MDEIIELLKTYDSKYKNIGKSWGKSLVDELTKTVKEGMSALDFLNTNTSTSNGTSGTGGSTSTPSGTSTGKSNYGLGDSGDAITKIQQALQLLVNNHLVQSGTYDSATASAVSLFQGQQGLYRSGLVDEETLKKLNELMNGRITIPHFDTGGMPTNDGLAFVHGKELILNKMDTSNILKSANVLKNLFLNFPKLDFGKLSNQRPQNNYNSPLVVNEITQNNNTPFDVANSNDNLARLMKKQLNFIGGTV
jgi:peptidoglycan hydrolase-like protein with peptidoglycan-binding domain